jgi:hypothetical protein
VDTKKCYRCKVVHPVAAFNKNRRTKDGLQAYCRECSKVFAEQSQAAHAEAIRLRFDEKLARVPQEGATKECRVCGVTKPLLGFYAHRSTKDGRANHCSDCAKKNQREWNTRNKEKIRENNEKRQADPVRRQRGLRQMRANWLKNYGLTPESYEGLLQSQGGVCAICGLTGQTWAERNLHVDHDHVTLEVRGLLCGRCNVGLGFFSDNVEMLKKAISYLDEPPMRDFQGRREVS